MESVAITGVAVSCALGTRTDEVWAAIREGESGIALTRRLDVSKLTCHCSGEMAEVPEPSREEAEHEGWSMPRGRLDRATVLALGTAREAILTSGVDLSTMDGYRCGVALGTSVGGLDEGEQFHWEVLHEGADAAHSSHLLVYPLYTAADALSIAFGLKGPKVVVSNACAAGANSIGWAADAIRAGRADVMLAGGVDVLDILSLAGFDSLKALDPEPTAPYSRSTGLNIGEGAALLVLEAAAAAAARGATILGYVRGYALTSDAHHATAPDPRGDGARRAMQGALAQAGLEPGDVDYVNGHGTGTPANDSAETKAVDAVFGPAGTPPISSTKSQVGHNLGAAGAVEAAVSVLALRDGVLPPTVNVADAAAVDHDIVANQAREAEVDVVVSNSFAFGGNNCTLVLSRHRGTPAARPDRRVVITGAGVVSALGVGRDEFLAATRAGTVAITADGPMDTSLSGTHLTAEIPEASLRRHLDPAYARRLDQLGRLLLSSVRLALADSGYTVTPQERERAGMIFGTSTGPMETIAQLTETIGTAGPNRVNPRLFPNSVMNAAAGHACLSLQLRGPLSTLATGCASGITALGYAADLVRHGEADVMFAASADELTPMLHFGLDKLGVLAGDEVRLYDRYATGFALGHGAVTLVVESLDSAQARGATILCEVVGQAITSDGWRIAGNAQDGAAGAESFRRAIDDAGLTAEDIGTVYGDARGTAALDLAEARAIGHVWKPGAVRVANITGQVGHLHSTTPLLAAVCATETVRTGWAPRPVAARDPLPELAEHLAADERDDDRACVVTAVNWGGTYASVVLRGWSGA